MFALIAHASIAQLVEQIPLKDKVEGSIPSGRTKVLKVLFARRRHDGAEPESRKNSAEFYA